MSIRARKGGDMAKGSDEIHGFLGKGTEFDGQLKFEGTVRIDGTFRGKIQASGTLVIGEGARVEAEIHCGTLLLHGEVVGNTQATQRIQAFAPARIRGDIETPVLVINEGVMFDGHSKMETTEALEQEPEKKISLLGKRDKPLSKDEKTQAERQ